MAPPQSTPAAGAAKVAMVAAGGSAKDIEKESALARLTGAGTQAFEYHFIVQVLIINVQAAQASPNSSSSTPSTQSRSA